ncbi:SUN domain-containing protein 1 [Caerostris extrusa]|uniref:SUN domain-containing protein 1 n=1 Tax=Caerostris extrusa TaxID=172846 RepID=A0AAV4S962_CAEEX|nr:SUN domain-containing protein 1 [Caerostris extrusa]
MKKPCCIDSINNSPEKSSCSMVLRSACSHGRSHKFVKNTNGQKQESARQKRKSIKATSEKLYITDSDKDSLKVDSPFESSLELLALKSSKTFAVLKESLFNQLQLSRSQKCEVTQLSKEDLGFVKKLNFSETSSPVTSLHLNAHFESTEFSDYVQDIEKDLNHNTAAMSRTRRLERSSARTLSESETEEDASFYENRVRLKRNKTSNAVLHTNSTGEKRFSQSLSNVYTSSNHSNSIRSVSSSAASPASSSRTSVTNYSYNSTPIGYSTPFQRNLSLNSAQMNMSAVQYSSSFDRLRWLIWRLCGRRKVVAILLLPLLLYLLYHLLGANTGITSKSYDVLSSSIATLASSIYSLLSHPLKQSEKVVIVEESSCPLSSSSFSEFWGIPSFFSNIFIAEKSTSFSSKSSSSDAKATSSEDLFMRQEIESNVVKTLDAKFNELSRKIQVSQNTKRILSNFSMHNG